MPGFIPTMFMRQVRDENQRTQEMFDDVHKHGANSKFYNEYMSLLEYTRINADMKKKEIDEYNKLPFLKRLFKKKP